jgi:hypothetical protein
LSAWRALVLAVVVPAVVVALSFASGRSRCHQHPKAGPGRASGALEAAVTTLILAVVFLGQEIGRRGFLPLRLCELMPGRRAAVLTGACDAIFHVPLLILTTTYQYAGSRWIVAPTVTAIHRRSHRCRNRLSSIRCYAIVDRRRSVRGAYGTSHSPATDGFWNACRHRGLRL